MLCAYTIPFTGMLSKYSHTMALSLYQAVVTIKQCNHGYCDVCLRKMSLRTPFAVKIHCDKILCNTMILNLSIHRFLTKLADTRFMVGMICLLKFIDMKCVNQHPHFSVLKHIHQSNNTIVCIF